MIFQHEEHESEAVEVLCAIIDPLLLICILRLFALCDIFS